MLAVQNARLESVVLLRENGTSCMRSQNRQWSAVAVRNRNERTCDELLGDRAVRDLLQCLEPVLLGGTARSAALQIKLIGTRAHLSVLLGWRSGGFCWQSLPGRMSNGGRRRYRLRRVSAIPASTVWSCGSVFSAFLPVTLARVAFGIVTSLLNPNQISPGQRSTCGRSQLRTFTITNFAALLGA